MQGISLGCCTTVKCSRGPSLAVALQALFCSVLLQRLL